MEVKIVLNTNGENQNKVVFSKYFCENSKNPIIILSNKSLYDTVYYININESMNPFETHDLGAGIWNNYPCYFANTYPINPGLLEWDILYIIKIQGFIGNIYINSNCKIYTPINYLLNKYDNELNYTYNDFITSDNPYELCRKQFEKYKNKYNMDLSFDECLKLEKDANEVFYNLDSFVISLDTLKTFCIETTDEEILSKYDTLIFQTNDEITKNSQIMNSIKSVLKDKQVQGEMCYCSYINQTQDINEQLKEEFEKINTFHKNNNYFNLDLSVGIICDSITQENAIMSYNFLDVKNKYITYSKYSKDVKHFPKIHVYSKPTILLPFNHNSGLSRHLGREDDLYSYNIIVGYYPFRLDYPCTVYDSSNIYSISNRSTYEWHLGFLKEDVKENLALYLPNNYLIDEKILKDYYIDKLHFNKFIVSSSKQKQQILSINPDAKIFFDYGIINSDTLDYDLYNNLKEKRYLLLQYSLKESGMFPLLELLKKISIKISEYKYGLY